MDSPSLKKIKRSQKIVPINHKGLCFHESLFLQPNPYDVISFASTRATHHILSSAPLSLRAPQWMLLETILAHAWNDLELTFCTFRLQLLGNGHSRLAGLVHGLGKIQLAYKLLSWESNCTPTICTYPVFAYFTIIGTTFWCSSFLIFYFSSRKIRRV